MRCKSVCDAKASCSRQALYELYDSPGPSNKLGQNIGYRAQINLEDDLNSSPRPTRSRRYGAFTFDSKSLREDDQCSTSGKSSIVREVPNLLS